MRASTSTTYQFQRLKASYFSYGATPHCKHLSSASSRLSHAGPEPRHDSLDGNTRNAPLYYAELVLNQRRALSSRATKSAMRRKLPAKRAPFGLVSSDFEESPALKAERKRATPGVSKSEIKKKRSRANGKAKKRRTQTAASVDSRAKEKQATRSGCATTSREGQGSTEGRRLVYELPPLSPAPATDAASAEGTIQRRNGDECTSRTLCGAEIITLEEV